MEERLKYSEKAKEDIFYWKKSSNNAILKRIRKLLESILETPFEGIGKPEPLKHNLSGKWYRRINKEPVGCNYENRLFECFLYQSRRFGMV